MHRRGPIWLAAALVVTCLGFGRTFADEPAKLTTEQRQELLAERDKLKQEAEELDAKGNTREALAAAQKLVAIQERLLGDDEGTANWYGWIAARYERLEDFTAAKLARRESLEINLRLLGNDHWQVTNSRLALLHVNLLESLSRQQRSELAEGNRREVAGVQLYNAGKYADSRRATTDAAEIRKRILGPAHHEYARSLHYLGQCLKAQGEVAQTESLYRQAIGIYKSTLGMNHPNYAGALNDLAVHYYSRGDLAQAEPLYRQAGEIYKQCLGENHASYAATLSSLGMLYREKGDYATAEPLLRQALQIKKQALGENHSSYATSLNGLAELHFRQGDFARAESLFRQLLEIRKRANGENHTLYAASLLNLAAVYDAQGEYGRAEPILRRAMEIQKVAVGESHPSYGLCANNLAVLYHKQGDYRRAEPLFQKSLEIERLSLGPDHPDYAHRLNNLAFLYDALGKHPQAVETCREGMEITKKTLGETHPQYVHSLHTLAFLHSQHGDHARAQPYFRRALEISHHNLELASAYQSQRQQLAMLADARYVLDAFVLSGVRSPQSAAAVWDEVLAWKGLVLSRQQAIRALAHRPELTPLLVEMQSTTSRLAALALSTPQPAEVGTRHEQIADLSAKKEELEQRLAAASKEYRAAKTAVKSDDVRAALPAGAALVDFLEFSYPTQKPDEQGAHKQQRRLAVFIVRREGSVQLLDLGEIEPIQAAIDVWRTGFGRGDNSHAAADQLRKLVWLPVAKNLAGATTVLISPDGDLGKLPFAALPGKAPGSFLLEDYALAVIPAPQTLISSNRRTERLRRTGPMGNLLIVADVDYDLRGAAASTDAKPKRPFVSSRAARDDNPRMFGSLAATKGELATIQKLYRDNFGTEGMKTLEGAAATQESLVAEAARHLYVHLATHGFFATPKFKSALERSTSAVQPGGPTLVSDQSLAGYHPGLLSGLVLAGANKPTDQDDGILTAEEVSSLNLSDAELVVLSACETGLGKTAGGEGLLGLQRAFQAAGASTVIASLWKVDDVATRDLMERFYENLWNKDMGRLQALREAQLWMLKERGPRGLKEFAGDAATTTTNRLPPYYWAAWVLSGDWR